MEKFINTAKNELLNNSILGVATYLGAHICASTGSQQEVVKKYGNGASINQMLEKAQKDELKEYDL